MRYVVMGLRADIDAWRRQRRIPVRDVVPVTTRSADALRGRSLSQDCAVIELPSWSLAPQHVRDAAVQNLEICRAASPNLSQAPCPAADTA